MWTLNNEHTHDQICHNYRLHSQIFPVFSPFSKIIEEVMLFLLFFSIIFTTTRYSPRFFPFLLFWIFRNLILDSGGKSMSLKVLDKLIYQSVVFKKFLTRVDWSNAQFFCIFPRQCDHAHVPSEPIGVAFANLCSEAKCVF